MRTYIKSGLKSLIFIIPFILLISFNTLHHAGYTDILKIATIFMSISIASAFITSFITHSMIKKRVELKKWYKSGIKSFNVIVPISSLISISAFSTTYRTFGAPDFFASVPLNILVVVILFFFYTLCFTIILGIPISIIVISISYFINRE